MFVKYKIQFRTICKMKCKDFSRIHFSNVQFIFKPSKQSKTLSNCK